MSLSPLRTVVRRYATAAAPIKVTATHDNASAPILANIQASWRKMSDAEKAKVEEVVLEKQKGDWKAMTLDEKLANYYVHYGDYGYRSAVHDGPNNGFKALIGTAMTVSFAGFIYFLVRSNGHPSPIPTMNAEYQKQTTEYMKEQNMNPISGVSSEGYKGKGMVQSP